MAHQERKSLPPAYKFIALWLHPLMLASVKRDFAGMEHFRAERGCVVCVNHVSHYDPLTTSLYLYDAGYPPFFLAKEALFRVPIVGKLLSGAGQIPVYRESGQAAGAYRAAVEGIDQGKTIVIMPEGTLTRDPGLWPMTGKTGAARVALSTRCPVVPLAQWGAQDVLAPYAKVLKLIPRKTIHALAGPPVQLSDLYERPMDAATLEEATARIMAAITALLEQVRGEAAPAQRFDPRRAGVPRTGNPRKARS
ncbi:MAG: lysophospholipid acyltransferase family protein [Dermatophilaceae bacterium]